MEYRQKKFRYEVILNASDLFGLSGYEAELLANRAGLSLKATADFSKELANLIKNKSQYKKLYEHAQISERMFQRIKGGRIPTKESLISIAVSLGLGLDGTKALLEKAGYALSDSIAWDAAIKTLIYEIESAGEYKNAVNRINDVLYDMDMPLLMTREKFFKSEN